MREIKPGDKIRVLIVDDSVLIRKGLSLALAADADIQVVGSASDGKLALQRIEQLNPDVITLDVEMPVLDGLATLEEMRRRGYRHRVVMLSSQTAEGARTTLEALDRGADDYAKKRTEATSVEMAIDQLGQEIIPKIKQFFSFRPLPSQAPAPQPPAPARVLSRRPSRPPEVLVIGISTGGPQALTYLLPKLPANFPLPVLVVQHMPPTFTKHLAQRLDQLSSLSVAEAEEGMPIEPGRVLIAPGDFHLKVRRQGLRFTASLDQGPPENCCRPAADVLFRSASEIWGNAVCCLVMTGMGQDGLAGARTLKANGATVLAQDEASSVVWGMPGEIVRANLADQVVPLDKIATVLTGLTKKP